METLKVVKMRNTEKYQYYAIFIKGYSPAYPFMVWEGISKEKGQKMLHYLNSLEIEDIRDYKSLLATERIKLVINGCIPA